MLDIVKEYNQGRRDFRGVDLFGAGLRGADLRGVDLQGADLSWADLSWANLRRADLREADLRGVNLSEADLQGADLRRANLRGADLQGADLRGADLRRANLRGADLQGADLYRANLYRTDLRKVNLRGANLQNTCLDPINPPNMRAKKFTDYDKNWKIGYRTKHSISIDPTNMYAVSTWYKAPVFSTSDTECHPGLYVYPTLIEAKQLSHDVIMVLFEEVNLHKAGAKYRVSEFLVWGEV